MKINKEKGATALQEIRINRIESPLELQVVNTKSFVIWNSSLKNIFRMPKLIILHII